MWPDLELIGLYPLRFSGLHFTGKGVFHFSIACYYVFAQQVLQIRQLAAKVLFALSVNNFNAVFSRISGRLAELSVTNGEESQDYTDIELIQYINIDILKLIKLLNEAIAKFR